jgi:Tol biopolymer transport system component
LHNPVLSPDSRSLLADGAGGLWLLDLERGAPTRLVENANLASWSPDGDRITFTTHHEAKAAIYTRPVLGPDQESLLVGGDEMKISGNWSPNTGEFVFASSNPESRLDLWALTPGSNSAPRVFLKTPANELQPRVSPDGHWIAYTSDESGAWEVYVQSFPTAGRKRVISVGGGGQPEWRRDGRELFYLSPDGTLMAVSVTTTAPFDVSRPTPLFHAAISQDLISLRNQYAAAPDGSRFIIETPQPPDPINVVVNWTALINP